jgi:hypothetical protein
MTGALFDRSNYSLIAPKKTSVDVTDARKGGDTRRPFAPKKRSLDGTSEETIEITVQGRQNAPAHLPVPPWNGST